jgi:hypothetical protein
LTVLGVPVAEGIEERAEALRRRISKTSNLCPTPP